jgi:hypothetical protein
MKFLPVCFLPTRPTKLEANALSFQRIKGRREKGG